ncbi:MAG TPA: HIT domain-containing protein [Bryobacteraceae bacterium]|jgi:ATP adenylyltransferase|nr:HIT domain-containing protein [Bryobacteraceae bacterium]
MDYLWTPWRSTYMKAKQTSLGCIFCAAAADPADDERNLVVFRAARNFVILNRYPYTSGHLMIAPYEHVSRLNGADPETALEMISLARRAERYIEAIYLPDGLNLGMNLGEAAGAGIEQHIHMHVLPRWKGDANFMTTVGETRIVPESLDETYLKLREKFASA